MNALAVHALIPLHQLGVGETADVVQVLGRPDDVLRMQELGLRDGTGVQMVQSGSPCIIKLQGNSLCFRAAEMLRVLVRPHLSST
ncbi:MAG TPA: FeoA family protein [Pirellulales bacterium]|nr:FeoA family protein [Pirellulales bacterium]